MNSKEYFNLTMMATGLSSVQMKIAKIYYSDFKKEHKRSPTFTEIEKLISLVKCRRK